MWMCAALWTWWEGEKFPQRQAWITERDDAFLLLLSLTRCSVDLLIPEIISASYSTGLRSDFEPEDAPTGHLDSVCLVFLLFPRRLYQVRRTNIDYSLCV